MWARPTADLWQPTFAAWSTDTFQVRPSPAQACDPRRPTSAFSGGINVALADGSVRAITASISPRTWWAACTPAGGEFLGSDF